VSRQWQCEGWFSVQVKPGRIRHAPAAVELTNVVPFLVEDELKAKGGIFSKGADWQPYVLTDGLLITGQNPASSDPAARALIKLLANGSE